MRVVELHPGAKVRVRGRYRKPELRGAVGTIVQEVGESKLRSRGGAVRGGKVGAALAPQAGGAPRGGIWRGPVRLASLGIGQLRLVYHWWVREEGKEYRVGLKDV